MFAYVRFVEDKDCQIVAASTIVGFAPCSEEDFDATRVYAVHSHGMKQEVNIVAMAESETQLEEVVKRMQIPGILDGSPTPASAEELGSQEDDEDSDEILQTHREGKRKRHEEGAERAVSEKVVRKSRGDKRLQLLYPVDMETTAAAASDDGDEDSGGTVPQLLYRESVQNYRNTKVSLQKSLLELEMLKQENEELRRMNKNLQEALVRKIFTAPGIDSTRVYGSKGSSANASSSGNGADEAALQTADNGQQLSEETMTQCSAVLSKQSSQQSTGTSGMQGSGNPMMQNDMQFLMGMNNAMQILMAMNNGMPFPPGTQPAFPGATGGCPTMAIGGRGVGSFRGERGRGGYVIDMSKKPICRHFAQKGGCRYGNTCAFYHPGMNGPPLP
ncbi:BEN domain-containing protein 5-like isoform X1 [Lampetra fluviatilis]